MPRTFKLLTLIIGAMTLLADQLSKYWAQKIPDTGVFIINQNLIKLKLEYLQNPYLAWGLRLPFFFVLILSVIIILFLSYLLKEKIKENNRASACLTALLVSAALSNFIERAFTGHVTDFISLTIWEFNWPTFNLADLLITFALLGLIINEFFKTRLMKKTMVLIVLLFLFLPLFQLKAQTNAPDVYIFTKIGCPYCAKALSLLETFKREQYPDLKIHDLDMLEKPELVNKFFQFAKAYNVSIEKVPLTFIGDKAIVGYQENEIRSAIENCFERGCSDPQKIVNNYFKEHPDKNDISNTNGRQTLGWLVLGIAAVGLALFIINKKF